MTAAQFNHFTRTYEHDCLAGQITEYLLCKQHCRIGHRYRVIAYAGLTAHPFAGGECMLKQTVHDFTNTAGFVGQLPGFLQLTENLGFAQYQRLQPTGYPEQVLHRFLTLTYVAVFVNFSRSQFSGFLQPLANLLSAAFRANAVNLGSIACTDNDRFFNITQRA